MEKGHQETDISETCAERNEQPVHVIRESNQNLPKRPQEILKQPDRNKFKIDLEHRDSIVLSENWIIHQPLSSSLIITALVVGSSIVMQTGKKGLSLRIFQRCPSRLHPRGGYRAMGVIAILSFRTALTGCLVCCIFATLPVSF